VAKLCPAACATTMYAFFSQSAPDFISLVSAADFHSCFCAEGVNVDEVVGGDETDDEIQSWNSMCIPECCGMRTAPGSEISCGSSGGSCSAERHTVKTSFTLSGDVSSVGVAAQASIKKVLAQGANVAASAVALLIYGGSVTVEATISVPSASAADKAKSDLASGVLADTASLQQALAAQFVADGVVSTSSTVSALEAPKAESTGGGDSGGCGGGCVGGIIGGCFVPVLMCILWLSGAFGPKCPSPFARKKDAAGAGPTFSSATEMKEPASNQP